MSLPLLSTATRYFMEVVRTGSITEAAAQAHVAPSAVSRQVAKLEDSLGCPLFERRARGMALTEAGERLAAWVHRAQRETELVADEVRGAAGRGRGRVHVACTEGFAAGFLPQVMASFRAAHPQASVHLRVGAPGEVSRWLLRGECEVGLKFAVAPEKGLKLAHGRRSPVVAVVGRPHPLARHKRVTLAELVRHPLALPDAGTTVRQALDAGCAQQSLHYEVVYTGNFAALLALAIRGEAPTLASELAVAHAVRAGDLVALPVDQAAFGARQAQLLLPEDGGGSPLLRDFVRHAAAALDEAVARRPSRSRAPRVNRP